MSESIQAELVEEQLGSSERGIEQQAQPLPESLRPALTEMSRYIPKPELYIKPDLPHHGVLHGEETAILAGVLINVAYEDVQERKGKEAADAFRSKIDEQAVLYAAAYHDCGRISDWRLFQGKEKIDGQTYKGEMQIHGPRGAHHLKNKIEQIDPNLSPEQADRMLKLVRFHTATQQETRDRIKDEVLERLHVRSGASRAARKAEKTKNFEDYEPEELMLRILQEADKLGLPRGYYSRKTESRRRTPFSAASAVARSMKSAFSFRRGRPGHIEKGLRFAKTTKLGLFALADKLTRTTRRDIEIDRKFSSVPHRSGSAMEAAQKIGLLKP